MIKYSCYVRVSTDKEEQASSIENQKMLFEKYIKENTGELFKIYQDIDSGTNSNRSGLSKLIEDAKKHKFNVLLVKEWSRISRNIYDSFGLKELFSELNIKVINVSTGLNAIEEDTLMFAVTSALAQKESEKISERTKQAFIAKALRGEFKSSRAPYGYSKVGTKLIIRDDDTPDIIRLIFEMYLEGNGSDKIAKYLNKNRISTPSQTLDLSGASALWYGSSIDKILRNESYVGHLVQHKTTTSSVTSKKRKKIPPHEYIVIENTHEAIIPKEVFYKVQEMIKLRHKKRCKANAHIFSNFLYCYECGRRLHYKANRKGYVCAGYNRHGKDVCSSHFIKESELEQLILDDLNNLLSKINQEKVINNFKKHLSSTRNNLKLELNKIDTKLNSLNNQKMNAIKYLVSETINEADYRKLCDDINSSIKKLENDKNELLKSNNDNFLDEALNELNVISENIKDIVKLNHKILSELIEKVVINENGEPRIYYKFSAQLNYINKLFLPN